MANVLADGMAAWAARIAEAVNKPYSDFDFGQKKQPFQTHAPDPIWDGQYSQRNEELVYNLPRETLPSVAVSPTRL